MREIKLLSILKETFGYSGFRFEQHGIINSILDGHDTLGVMPTGGGKSLCYQIPALYFEGVTIVISPLISLMQDQVMNLKETGVKAVFLNSSQSLQSRNAAKEKILKGKVKLIYISPEGILSPGVLDFFNKISVSLIAIDEAHCVSQWGHEFRKDYMRLGELKNHFPGVPLVALTATADEKTRTDIANQLNLNHPKTFVASFDRPNIRYSIADRTDEIKQLDQFIRQNHSDETGIVYCLSRDKVERVAESLKKLGHPAVAYHAGLSQQVRAKNQKKFNEDERIIVVATIAFGMGIDRPDVRFVAHLDLPKSIESYYQETGRAGRDGRPSSAWMIYGLQDVVKLSQMIETTDANDDYKKLARFKLDAMLGLCETPECRRTYLLEYFGQKSSPCGNCDTCLEPPVIWNASEDAQKIMSAIYRTNQTFGANHIIDVLRGSKNAKISEKGHDQLSVFGIGKDHPKEHWNSILRQLLNQNYIGIKSWEYRSLCLKSRALEILKGNQKFFMRKQVETHSKKTKKEVSATDNSDLFGALKALRLELARQRGVPPYIIFGDKSLHDMCNLLPRNEEEFLLVSGVGLSKLELYGSKFLERINQYSH